MKISEVFNLIDKNAGVERIKLTIPEGFSLDAAIENFQIIANRELEKKGKKYDITPVKDVIAELIRWAYLLPGMESNPVKGFLLKGHTGVGKTFLFKTFANFLKLDNIHFKQLGETVPLFPQVVNVKRIAGDYQDPDKGGYRIIQRYANFRCLVLDDIGKEDPESKNFGNRLNVVEEIINLREERGLLTFGTTNLEKMNESYDDRTVSRMYELFNIKAINHGTDFRNNE